MEEEIEEPTDYVYYGDALEPLEEGIFYFELPGL